MRAVLLVESSGAAPPARRRLPKVQEVLSRPRHTNLLERFFRPSKFRRPTRYMGEYVVTRQR